MNPTPTPSAETKARALFDKTHTDYAGAVADLTALYRDVEDLQQQLDASCNAEELRQVKAARDSYKAKAEALLKCVEKHANMGKGFCIDCHNVLVAIQTDEAITAAKESDSATC